MSYWIFRLEWSQTDHENVIVEAHTEDGARGKILANARYIMKIAGPIDRIIQ